MILSFRFAQAVIFFPRRSRIPSLGSCTLFRSGAPPLLFSPFTISARCGESGVDQAASGFAFCLPLFFCFFGTFVPFFATVPSGISPSLTPGYGTPRVAVPKKGTVGSFQRVFCIVRPTACPSPPPVPDGSPL